MDKTVVETIGIWLAIILATVVLGSWAALMSIQRQYSDYQQKEVDAIDTVKEYRQWNSYDNTTVYAQDVASLALKTRGFPNVYVDTTVGPVVTWGIFWNEATPKTDFTATTITSLLPVNAQYKSSIVRDLNGSIIRVEFRRD